MTLRVSSPGSQEMSASRWFCRLCISPVLAALLVSAAMAGYGGGAGTADDPYRICDAEQLNTLGSTPGDWDKHFVLEEDIDLTGYDEENFHLIGYWVALGSMDNKAFTGIFDGNGLTISNLTYRDNSQNSLGLFRYVEVGEIRNLKLVNMKMSGKGLSVGSLVGYLKNGAVVNCHAAGVSIAGDTGVGGLVGNVDGAIAKSSSRGKVTGTWYVGGLVGQVGEATVSKSYSKAAVSGTESVGGLVGATLREAAIIDSCYATGNVEGGTYVGGLVGQVVQGRVFRCYCVGAVSGDQATGGLTGSIRVFGDVIASFWDQQSSGQANSAGGMGRTTDEMRSAATFGGWDFDTTWSICDGMSYPVLLWQIPTSDLRCPDGVTGRDFAWFAMQWMRQDCGAGNLDCEWADFDLSGSVSFPDLAILANDWLVGMD